MALRYGLQLKLHSFGTGIVVLLISVHACNAQYFQFSQYNYTSLRINPAIPGTSKFALLSFDYRNQRTGGDFNLNSNFVSASYPLLNPSTGRPWSGVGVSLMDDRSAGLFKTQEAALSYAVNVRLSRYQQLSLGFKGLYQTRSINLDGLFTESQYVPDRGLDESAFNGEHFQKVQTNLYTLSAGIYWQETDRKENVTGYWGISFFDFNKPSNSFSGTHSKLPSAFVFTGGFEAIRKKEYSVFPEILYTHCASTNVLNLGTRLCFEFKPMPNQVSARIDVITKYVLGRSGIAGVQLHRENFSVGFTYDFPVILRNTGNLGAFEVGLQLRRPVETRTRMKELAKRKQSTRGKRTPLNPKPVQITPPKETTAPLSENQVSIDTIKTLVAADSVIRKPTLQTDANAGPIKQEPMLVEKITLHFQFHYNSTDLDDETEKFLDALSQTMKEDPQLRIKITGHTDNIGPDKFNQKLSMRRAESVRNFLVRQGIEQARMEASGKGMVEPIGSNETEEGRAKNRRVELMVYRSN